MSRIEEAITEHWGERCPDFDESCPTCQAWGEFDRRAALPEPARAGEAVAWRDESMAMHWIDRYAAGIDDEPQMNRILACVAAPAPTVSGRPTWADESKAMDDYFGELVARARQAAAKASVKFPQPNFVALKIAEEAGEVVRGAVHYAEKRMEWSEVEGEIVQLLAMLLRFVTEGDQVNGITPPARESSAPTCVRGCPPWEIPCRIGCEHIRALAGEKP